MGRKCTLIPGISSQGDLKSDLDFVDTECAEHFDRERTECLPGERTDCLLLEGAWLKAVECADPIAIDGIAW